jgi:hypothetical protein
MGNGNGNMLREVQRTLPALYSNMDVMSTLGINPAGPCHYPLKGWSQFADMVQPLIERDNYGIVEIEPLTPPNLRQAHYADKTKTAVALEFDQPVCWDNSLIGEFYLDGEKVKVVSGSVAGNIMTLKLKESCGAGAITYINERFGSQKRLLFGENGLCMAHDWQGAEAQEYSDISNFRNDVRRDAFATKM